MQEMANPLWPLPRGQSWAHLHPPPKAPRGGQYHGIRVPSVADISAWIAYNVVPISPTFIINLTFLGKLKSMCSDNFVSRQKKARCMGFTHLQLQ